MRRQLREMTFFIVVFRAAFLCGICLHCGSCRAGRICWIGRIRRMGRIRRIGGCLGELVIASPALLILHFSQHFHVPGEEDVLICQELCPVAGRQTGEKPLGGPGILTIILAVILIRGGQIAAGGGGDVGGNIGGENPALLIRPAGVVETASHLGNQRLLPADGFPQMVVHPAGVSDIVLIRAHRKGIGQLQPRRESFRLPEPVNMVFPGIAEPEKDADRRLRKVEPGSVPPRRPRTGTACGSENHASASRDLSARQRAGQTAPGLLPEPFSRDLSYWRRVRCPR